MRFVYPAIFHPNDDGNITVTFPDLSGCVTEGRGTEDALRMAQDALTQFLAAAADLKLDVAPASPITDVACERGEFTSLVYAEIRDNRAVRRTVSLPKWMDDKVSESGLSLSKVLQDALAERLSAG